MPRTTDPRRVLATDAVFFPDSHVFGSIPRQYPEVSKPLKYMAVQQGSVFHAMPARNNDGQWEMWPASWGYVYGPVDPSTEFGDVEGATYAYDTGTHWKFAACSPQEQIDFAADVRTFAIDQFAVAIAKAQVKVAEATNAPVKAAAVSKLSALVSFADAVGAHCHSTVVKAVLGHYHEDRHNDHRRDLVVAGIDAVLAAWAETGKTDKAVRQDRSNVSTTASSLRSTLMATHAIEWRHERVARLAAEKKAAEQDNAQAEASDSPAEQGS